MIGLREDQQMKARMVNFLNFSTAHCGRGLAPDGGESATDAVTDTPPSGASPLPHWTAVTVKAVVVFPASKAAG